MTYPVKCKYCEKDATSHDSEHLCQYHYNLRKKIRQAKQLIYEQR